MKQRGFTLLELVVVIVVLGILAAVAIPHFINIKQDALKADLYALQGELKSANKLVYSKAALKGIESLEYNNYNTPSEANIMMDGKRVDLHYGQIQASKWNAETILHLNKDDWHMISTPGVFGQIYFTPKGAPAFNNNNIIDIEKSLCYLQYGFDKQHYRQPVYTLKTAGC